MLGGSGHCLSSAPGALTLSLFSPWLGHSASWVSLNTLLHLWEPQLLQNGGCSGVPRLIVSTVPEPGIKWHPNT